MADKQITDFTAKALDKQSPQSLKDLRNRIKLEIRQIARKERRTVNRIARKKRNRLHIAISHSKGEKDDIDIHRLNKRIRYLERKTKKFFFRSLQLAKDPNQSNESKETLTRAQLYANQAERTKVVLKRHLAGDFEIKPIYIPRISKVELAKKFFK